MGVNPARGRSNGLVETPSDADTPAMPDTPTLLELAARIVDRLDDWESAVGFHEPLRRGSVEGYVSIEPTPDEPDELLLVVRLRVMRLPAPDRGTREALFTELLHLNHAFRGRASFSISDDGIVSLTAGRPLTDLDPGEVLDLILWTSQQGDHHDDRLQELYG